MKRNYLNDDLEEMLEAYEAELEEVYDSLIEARNEEAQEFLESYEAELEEIYNDLMDSLFY